MTRTGIIGDLHQRLDALERTLAGPLAGCERVILAGDLLDRGPSPAGETLDRVLELGAELLVGNHELGYLGGPRLRGLLDHDTVATDIPARLRELVLDGKLRAATSVELPAGGGELLVVHAGVTRHVWQRVLGGETSPRRIALELNRLLLRAVASRDFRHPVFASIADLHAGPIWAMLREDLLADGLPPIAQVVGHVVAREEERRWHRDPSGGSIFPVDWGEPTPGHPDEDTGGVLGHLAIGEPAGA